MYDLSGNFIDEFVNIDEATNKLNLKAKYIKRCLIGERKTYNSYIWKFK